MGYRIRDFGPSPFPVSNTTPPNAITIRKIYFHPSWSKEWYWYIRVLYISNTCSFFHYRPPNIQSEVNCKMASTIQPSTTGSNTTNGTAVPSSCKVVSAVTIAKSLLAEVGTDLLHLKYKPKLVGLLANDDIHAKTYAEMSAKTCREK